MSDADRSGTPGEAASSSTEGEGGDELPSIDFSTFVLSLSHSALVHLGDAPTQEDTREVHLPLARQTIDLLSLLQEKTRNNLTASEERLLEQALTDLRLRFVEVSRARNP
jgi:hypothetical protein